MSQKLRIVNAYHAAKFGSRLFLRASSSYSGATLKVDIGSTYYSKHCGLIEDNDRLPYYLTPKRYGDDAFFTSNQLDRVFLGVLDGVGGCHARKDNQIYKLTRLIASKMRYFSNTKYKDSEIDAFDPKKLLVDAIEVIDPMLIRDRRLSGTTTICWGRLDLKNKLLQYGNLGDSGFRLIRNNKVVFESKPQTFDFNGPYQLEFPYRLSLYDKRAYSVDDAEFGQLDIQHDDWIIFGTDGLWDNLFNSEIEELCNDSAAKVSQNLAAAAYKRGGSLKESSPFEVAAKQAGWDFQGGKLDDTSVIAVHVLNNLD